MIVNPNKFEQFDKIPLLNNKNTPDVIFYMSVFQLFNANINDSLYCFYWR